MPSVPLFEDPSTDFFRRECVSISIPNDTILEDTEKFQVALNSSDETVRIVQGASTVYIIDDDNVRVSLEKRVVTVSERDGLVRSAVCVSLVGRTQQNIEVTLETQPTTAESEWKDLICNRQNDHLLLLCVCIGNSDYIPVSTTLTFVPTTVPEQRRCINVSIIDDTSFENDEQFLVLMRAQHAAVSIDISQTEVLILDDDIVTLSLSHSTERLTEGDELDLCVGLSGSTERNVSYQLDAQSVEGEQVSCDSRTFRAARSSLLFKKLDSSWWCIIAS